MLFLFPPGERALPFFSLTLLCPDRESPELSLFFALAQIYTVFSGRIQVFLYSSDVIVH